MMQTNEQLELRLDRQLQRILSLKSEVLNEKETHRQDKNKWLKVLMKLSFSVSLSLCLSLSLSLSLSISLCGCVETRRMGICTYACMHAKILGMLTRNHLCVRRARMVCMDIASYWRHHAMKCACMRITKRFAYMNSLINMTCCMLYHIKYACMHSRLTSLFFFFIQYYKSVPNAPPLYTTSIKPTYWT